MNSNSLWGVFPYPTLFDRQFQAGSLLEVHDACRTCPTLECTADAAAAVGEPRQCRFGVTYARIDNVRWLTGVIGSDFAAPNARTRRRFRDEPERRVWSRSVRSAVAAAQALGAGVVEDFDRSKAEVLERLERDPEMHAALAEQLRKDFQQNLDQSHDFLQLVKLVQGHAEVLLREKYSDLPITEAADRLPTEGAIYYSTQLMLVKMDALVFLHEINRALGSESRFQIHPLVVKYVRIYDWQAKQKEVALRLEGACYATCLYNGQAIGAVVQGLLDNLVKYAPAGSKAAVVFDEQDYHVNICFSSLGPRIGPEEVSQIFLPGYRGKAARRIEMSGLGVGLATARRISDALELDLRVEQDAEADSRFADRFRTAFSLRLQKAP